MTERRSKLIDPSHAGTYHCINRCVRRAWLCGFDRYLGKSFEHRKAWVQARIVEVGAIFACGIYSYAVMSNHLHLVVHMAPATARDWPDHEVAARWVRLYPTESLESDQNKTHTILQSAALINTYRGRLANLSWLMKSISEPIARRANLEDKVNGRFWQGRFKSQVLRDENAMLAAMTYVDLNPVRAGIAESISASEHTSVQARYQELQKDPTLANAPIEPLIGTRSLNLSAISVGDYLALVDFSGRQFANDKRGRIEETEPKVLSKLGLSKSHWNTKVKAIGSGYWRVVGTLEDLRELAKTIGQRTLFGTGLAKVLSKI